VYILGAGHSGSTLLATLLGRHPAICTVGEVKAPAIGDASRYRCSCGQDILSCEFWQAVRADVHRRGTELRIGDGSTDIRRARDPYVRYLLKPLHRGTALESLRDLALSLSPAWRRHRDRVQMLTEALARAACEVSGKQVFVDSSKTGLQLKYLRRNPSVDVKVLRLIRDGRGVANSYRKAEGLPIGRGAWIWRRSNEESEAIVPGLPPDRWLDLRYEDLCREPEVQASRIFSFLGVEPVMLQETSSEVQHVLGNDNMRLQPREIRLDERWRRDMTPADLSEFERIAGGLNRRFGFN
jgi:hypothetical protein